MKGELKLKYLSPDSSFFLFWFDDLSSNKKFKMKIYSWNEKYKCNKSSNVSKQNLCWLRLLAKVTTEKGQDGDDLPIDSNNQGRRYR